MVRQQCRDLGARGRIVRACVCTIIAPALPFLASSITAGAAAARGLIATRIESLGRSRALVRIDVQRVFRPTPALLLRIAGADEHASARQLEIPCEGVDDPQGFVEQIQACLQISCLPLAQPTAGAALELVRALLACRLCVVNVVSRVAHAVLGVSAHRPHAMVHPATNLDFVPVAALPVPL